MERNTSKTKVKRNNRFPYKRQKCNHEKVNTKKQNLYKQSLTMFNMKKILKKWGNSLVIVLTPEDAKVYDIQEGDFIELTITKIKKLKEKKE